MSESTMSALKRFFDRPPLTMQELKDLSKDERADLANQVFEATGWDRREAS